MALRFYWYILWYGIHHSVELIALLFIVVYAQELQRHLSGSEIDLTQQKSLLSLELSNRDLIIEQLQAEKQALDDKYQHSGLQVGGATLGGRG